MMAVLFQKSFLTKIGIKIVIFNMQVAHFQFVEKTD